MATDEPRVSPEQVYDRTYLTDRELADRVTRSIDVAADYTIGPGALTFLVDPPEKLDVYDPNIKELYRRLAFRAFTLYGDDILPHKEAE